MIRLLTTTLRSALHRRSSSPMSVALFGCERLSGFGLARNFSVNALDFAELGHAGLGYAGLDSTRGMHQGRGKSTITGFIVAVVRLVLAIPSELINSDHPIPRGRCRHDRHAPT
jgi:hypothetical protein